LGYLKLGTYVDHICKLIETELNTNNLLQVMSFCEFILEANGIELVSRMQASSPTKAGVGPGDQPPQDYAVVVVKKRVPCGKPNCSKCPHGPYYYSVQRTRRGKLKWKYLGLTITGADQ
jgi:hypothetical protein